MANTKAHTRYRTKSGIIVPGVTTVLNLLAKPALVYWAWNLGMQGEDYRKVRDKAASVGTIAHYLIECDIKGTEPDLGEFTPNDLKKARVAFGAFRDWRVNNKVITLACEAELVSEKYLYGGKIDWVAVDAADRRLLLDIKTSKAIYTEHKYQLAAYWHAWDESHPKEKIDRAAIIQLNKVTGEFSYHPFGRLDYEFEIFLHLRDIYAMQKKSDANRDKNRAYSRAVTNYIEEQEKKDLKLYD